MDTNVSAGSYLAAVRDLNNLQTNYQVIQQIKASGGRMNQHSIPEFTAFLEKLGHNVKDLNKLNVIHVAGTKGKGSTCAFTLSILSQLSSQLEEEGKRPLKIGLFTSPHLIQVRERIQINGQPISQIDFAKYFYQTHDALRSPHPPLRKVSADSPDMPMYFRFLTLMAYHTFLREHVDVAIMEVGVGGEYDSTNVVQQPVVCGIASLGIDHQNSLGSTIEEIAWHKAGIIKHKVPVVSVEQVPEALRVIEERAKENDAELRVVKPVDNVELGIQGVHQRANAALATALCRTWALRTHNVPASDLYIARGLQLANWPGRSQSFPSPRVPSLTWHVDGAHTTESMRACANWFSSTSSPCVLLFNAAHNRDARALLETLHTSAPCNFVGAVFCPNVSTQRADSNNFTVQKDDELAAQWESARVWEELTGNSVKVVPSINEAVEYVEDTYTDVRVLATGSLHLVGGVLDVAKGSI
ncbi:Folylpolyglutamate synthetase [Coemansia sp. RSA 1199]|nr:Folylpolyglutamate synthetase [Coemansia sp. RSA 1199]